MRLNAFLARAGIASRRKADEFIKSGRVSVNGQIGHLNTEVGEGDKVEFDGQPLVQQKLRYILLNKPIGYVTTLHDPENRPTILDLLSIDERVAPVGRLDFNTSGALLMTNDGELAHKLMHPSFEFNKTYVAEIEGTVTEDTVKKLTAGIELEDGLTSPAKVRKLADNKIELTIHEGKNRQVRRMLDVVGLPVKKLHRSQYGPLNLHGLEPGRWRELTQAELLKLKR